VDCLADTMRYVGEMSHPAFKDDSHDLKIALRSGTNGCCSALGRRCPVIVQDDGTNFVASPPDMGHVFALRGCRDCEGRISGDVVYNGLTGGHFTLQQNDSKRQRRLARNNGSRPWKARARYRQRRAMTQTKGRGPPPCLKGHRMTKAQTGAVNECKFCRSDIEKGKFLFVCYECDFWICTSCEKLTRPTPSKLRLIKSGRFGSGLLSKLPGMLDSSTLPDEAVMANVLAAFGSALEPHSDYTVHPDGQTECPGNTTSCLSSLTYFNTTFLTCCATRVCDACSRLLHPKPPCACRLCGGTVLGQFEHEKQNLKRQLQWARTGSAEAQYQFGMGLHSGTIKRSVDEGLLWMAKAADQGHTIAAANLAIIHMKGEGVPVSNKDAFHWMSIACDHGYDTFYLGLMKQDGIGCEVDKVHANELMLRSPVSREIRKLQGVGLDFGEAMDKALRRCGLRPDGDDFWSNFKEESEAMFKMRDNGDEGHAFLKHFGLYAEGFASASHGAPPMPRACMKGVLHTCVECGKPATTKCAECRMTHYCGTKCQRASWKEHKQFCKMFKMLTQIRDRNQPEDDDFESAKSFEKHRRDVKKLKAMRTALSAVAPAPTFLCCNHCGETSDLMACACDTVKYCSRKCQKADWKPHKASCTANRNRT